MMNEQLIVSMLVESDMKRRYYGEMYNLASSKEMVKYCQPYLSALADFDARTKMLLAFGYMIQRDENGEIIGITEYGSRRTSPCRLLDENGEIIGITDIK